MTTLLILLLFVLLTGASTRNGRHRQSPTSKFALMAAIVFAMLFFGYAVGKDLAKRDSSRDAATRPAQVK